MVDFVSQTPAAMGGVAAVAVIGLLLRGTRPDAKVAAGAAALAYGRPLKLLVGLLWFVWPGLTLAVILDAADDPVPAILVVPGFLAAVLAMHAEFFGVRILYDGYGIRTRSPWRRARFVPWESVVQARYSGDMMWYVLETEGRGRVRLHLFLNGVDSLLSELERRGVPVTRGPGRAE